MNWELWAEAQAARIQQLELRVGRLERARLRLTGRLRDQRRRAEYWRARALSLRDRQRDRERWYGR
jgi:hypothetical protein